MGKGKIEHGGDEETVGIGDEGISRGRPKERRKKPALRPLRIAQRDPCARPTLLKLDPYARQVSGFQLDVPPRLTKSLCAALRRCKLRTLPRRAAPRRVARPPPPSLRQHPRIARGRGEGDSRVRTPYGHTSIRISRGNDAHGVALFRGTGPRRKRV